MGACYWSPEYRRRFVHGQHEPDCNNPRSCSGCIQCPPANHCVIDRHRHLTYDEKQTCITCLNKTRRDLRIICELVALLPTETIDRGGTSFDPIPTGSYDTKLPGGDALVMLAPGNHDGTADPGIELPSDPQPPLAMLASWEDDWRQRQHLQAAGPATYHTVAEWLNQNMSWAAQHHPAYDEFARDLAATRTRLEHILKAGDRLLKAAAPCFECGGDLTRPYAPPNPCTHQPRPCGCDQGGLVTPTDPYTPVWRCAQCDATYTAAQYWLALRAAAEHERHVS